MMKIFTDVLKVVGVLVLLPLGSCQSVPKAELSKTGNATFVSPIEGDEFAADTSLSVIEWIGTKPVGKHHGTIKLNSGKLLVVDGVVKGGHFVIDINSLRPDDRKAKSNATLQEHLLSDDFFEVMKFPHAVFTIANVKEASTKSEIYVVTGNLQLKDVAKSISFPASIKLRDSKIEAFANFNMNRTIWNMNYGNDKSLGNWFINPIVNVRLHLIANKNVLMN